jgi:hypothetical protein
MEFVFPVLRKNHIKRVHEKIIHYTPHACFMACGAKETFEVENGKYISTYTRTKS